MKIGILTLPFNNNYGGYLQAYALLTILKQMGHEVELIYRRHNRRPFKWRVKFIIKSVIKGLIGRPFDTLIPNQEKDIRRTGRLMMPFVDKYITLKSKPLYSSREFVKYVSGRYDAIIVGSDQIWRPEYGPHIQDFFLENVPDANLVRIAYAASFGSDKPIYTEHDRDVCGKALCKFNAVSVREKGALKVMSNFRWKINTELKVVLDPTLLLSKDDYNSLLPSISSPAKGKIFTYILDSSEDSKFIAQNIAKETGLEIFDFLHGGIHNSVLPSIENWLCGIRDAAIVITDSYHGSVFSIIFNTPFITNCNMERGADRFTTLLEHFNLEDRMAKQFYGRNILNIDWNSVNEKLRLKRYESKIFLQKALE